MGLRSWLRERMHGRTPDSSQPAASDEATTGNQHDAGSATPSQWEPLPAYVPVQPEEHTAACVIASAIAAGDRPASSFKIRSVSIANPEYRRVAVIATALAAGALSESAFTVKNIYKMKEEGSHAA